MSEARDKLTRLEALNDEDLLERAWAELSALCGSECRPKKWTMTIPVDADRDSDILFGEVLKRYTALKRENALLCTYAMKLEGRASNTDWVINVRTALGLSDKMMNWIVPDEHYALLTAEEPR